MLRIYLTDLAAYNKGFLHGEWISLPCDNLQEQLNKILKAGEALCFIEEGYYEKHEEWFISDYEWEEIEVFSVEEYDNIHMLNKAASRLEELDKRELKAVSFLLLENFASSIEDALTKLDDVIVYQNTTMEDLAYDLINECYEVDKLPSIIANHIDYDGVASDLLLEGRYYRIGDDIYEYCA